MTVHILRPARFVFAACCVSVVMAAGAAETGELSPATAAASAVLPDPTDIQRQLKRYFFDAAREGRRDMLTEFITARQDLDLQDDKGYTALILAAYHGHRDVVEQLLAAGANPCVQDQRGNTALMGAIFKGEVAIARRLVEADCAPDQRNRAGQTAAMVAALFQRTELLRALEARGADLTAKDARGNDVPSLLQGKFAPPLP